MARYFVYTDDHFLAAFEHLADAENYTEGCDGLDVDIFDAGELVEFCETYGLD